MVVTLKKTSDSKRLIIRISGATSRIKEDGKGEKVTEFPSREDAIAEADKLIARRTGKGAWIVEGRTDTDRYLRLLDELRNFKREVSQWTTLSRRELHLFTWPPRTLADFAELAPHLDGLTLPDEYVEFLSTTNGLSVHANFAHEDCGRMMQVQILGISADYIRTGVTLIGKAPPSCWAWEDALLHLDSGQITTHEDRNPQACDEFASFDEFLQHQLKEVRETVYQMRFELERDD